MILFPGANVDCTFVTDYVCGYHLKRGLVEWRRVKPYELTSNMAPDTDRLGSSTGEYRNHILTSERNDRKFCRWHLFMRRSKNTSKLRVTGLCEGNSPETSEFPAQRASNAENVSIWWRNHACPFWFFLSHRLISIRRQRFGKFRRRNLFRNHVVYCRCGDPFMLLFLFIQGDQWHRWGYTEVGCGVVCLYL